MNCKCFRRLVIAYKILLNKDLKHMGKLIKSKGVKNVSKICRD